MKRHELKNGDRIPALGLGTWKSRPGEVGAAVQEALRLGYRHVDCAKIYCNEAEVGEALQSALEGGVARSELWITSKLWNCDHRAEHVRPALEKQLADLRLDYLDLYLIHWPVAIEPGVLFLERAEQLISLEEVPLLETWQALEDCVGAGLCRHIGVSNHSARNIKGIVAGASIRPAVNQVELHPYLQQRGLLDWCRKEGVLVTAYSPLGSKDRPARMKKPDEPELLKDPVVVSIAERLGVTPAQVLIGWAVQRGTIAIPKSVSPARMAENLAAAELEIPETDMQLIAGLDRGYRFVDGAFWAIEDSPYTVEDLWGE